MGEYVKTRANDKDHALTVLTGFTLDEILEIWSVVKDGVLARHKRGRRPKFSHLDQFFIFLIQLRHNFTFEKLGLDFNLEASAAHRIFFNMVNGVRESLCREYLQVVSKKACMENDITMKSFPSTGYLIVDSYFQPCQRPSARQSVADHHFCRKYHEYGLKVTTVHLADGRMIYATKHDPGSTLDIQQFKNNLEAISNLLKKSDSEMKMEDNDPLHQEYPNHWIMIGDRAYTRADRLTRVVCSKKNPSNEAEIHLNELLLKDRMLIESFYGRMLKLFGVVKDTYRYDHSHYDDLFLVCVALTNYHVMKYPLTEADRVFYKRTVNTRLEMARNRIQKKTESRLKHEKKLKEKRKRAFEEISDHQEIDE